ncbi:MAG: hypothetical protein OXC44_01835 [Proteobacteria bacterium]|nr:hypothetical protein [Pseudomonadota bacterium]
MIPIRLISTLSFVIRRSIFMSKASMMCIFALACYHHLGGGHRAWADIPSSYRQAMEYYDKGYFGESIRLLESIAEHITSQSVSAHGINRAMVFYNLGHAYWQDKAYAPALAAYLKAKVYAPYHEDIEKNIQHIFHTLKLTKPDIVHKTLYNIPYTFTGVWLWILAAKTLLLILWIMGIPFFQALLPRFLVHSVTTVLGLVLASSVVMFITMDRSVHTYGVVLKESSEIWSTPHSSQVLIGNIPKYTIVRLTETYPPHQAGDDNPTPETKNQETEKKQIDTYYKVFSLSQKSDKDLEDIPLTGWLKEEDIIYY